VLSGRPIAIWLLFRIRGRSFNTPLWSWPVPSSLLSSSAPASSPSSTDRTLSLPPLIRPYGILYEFAIALVVKETVRLAFDGCPSPYVSGIELCHESQQWSDRASSRSTIIPMKLLCYAILDIEVTVNGKLANRIIVYSTFVLS
jgi:hypothetical protein